MALPAVEGGIMITRLMHVTYCQPTGITFQCWCDRGVCSSPEVKLHNFKVENIDYQNLFKKERYS